MVWNDKRWHSLDYHLKTTYGEKIYKLSLDGGMTCPNRDGTVGIGGCIFCSAEGSGDFSADRSLSITEQIGQAKEQVAAKRKAGRYIAYFQAFTNTYAPVPYLRSIFIEAITHPDIAVLSVATRPDCLGPDVLDLLSELNEIKPVWVELGLQTIHEESAAFIRRGYPLKCFCQAAHELQKRKLTTIVHVILGLPTETREQMLKTVLWLNHASIQGIKLHLLHILEGTDLADYYRSHPFPVMTMDEYTDLIVDCITHIDPDIVIHRLTGDGPKELLIAPSWSSYKRTVLNTIQKKLKDRDLWQGKDVASDV